MHRFYDLSTFRSLRHRNFRLLVEGNVISTSGFPPPPFFFFTAAAFFGAISGALADRLTARILMITQTLAMIQAIVYCLAVYFKVIVFWHIAVLAFMLGCIDTLNQTVRQSLVNGMVPKEGRISDRQRRGDYRHRSYPGGVRRHLHDRGPWPARDFERTDADSR